MVDKDSLWTRPRSRHSAPKSKNRLLRYHFLVSGLFGTQGRLGQDGQQPGSLARRPPLKDNERLPIANARPRHATAPMRGGQAEAGQGFWYSGRHQRAFRQPCPAASADLACRSGDGRSDRTPDLWSLELEVRSPAEFEISVFGTGEGTCACCERPHSSDELTRAKQTNVEP